MHVYNLKRQQKELKDKIPGGHGFILVEIPTTVALSDSDETRHQQNREDLQKFPNLI